MAVTNGIEGNVLGWQTTCLSGWEASSGAVEAATGQSPSCVLGKTCSYSVQQRCSIIYLTEQETHACCDLACESAWPPWGSRPWAHRWRPSRSRPDSLLKGWGEPWSRPSTSGTWPRP